MKSGWFGYDKNQIRVYFTALQAGYQRRLDQWEDKLSDSRNEINQLEKLVVQLQQQVNERHERIQYLETLWPRTESIRIKLLRQARLQARIVVSDAKATRELLRQESHQIAAQANQQHGNFVNMINTTNLVITGQQLLLTVEPTNLNKYNFNEQPQEVTIGEIPRDANWSNK
ncbi:MAG: hypothetical protein ACM3PA_00530 [Methanomassiliicoccales archaeon]